MRMIYFHPYFLSSNMKYQFAIGFIEIMSLLGLSIIPSKENFVVHKTCFISFVLTSFINMCLTYYLMQDCYNQEYNNNPPIKNSFQWTPMAIKSIEYKRTILKSNIFAIPALIYFYWRHNVYCEPYIYSIFCFLEYVIVFMNIGYHFR